MSDNRSFLPMLGPSSFQDKTAYYNPYPNILSESYRRRNFLENIYRDKLGRWYPYGLPSLYSKPSDLSHLIGSDDYYPARDLNYTLRYPMEPSIDYYLDYGHKYANRFKYQTKQRLSTQGQRWLDSTFVYLQRMMESELRRNPSLENNPIEFSNFAFNTHPNAYIKAGFLTLPMSDLCEIALTPSWKNMDFYTYRNSAKQIKSIMFPFVANRLLSYPYSSHLGYYESWGDVPECLLYHLLGIE